MTASRDTSDHVDNTLTAILLSASTVEHFVDALFEYMHRRGTCYYDECVTQLQHALQAAYAARSHNASPEHTTAALLHDIGHFLMEEENERGSFLTDDCDHETVGADYMKPFLCDEVIEPIRLHVAAKRYLCTIDNDYFSSLSEASQRSFELQGKHMSTEEVAVFETHPFSATAVLLRRWDDQAKVRGREVAGLTAYRSEILRCVRREYRDTR